MGIGHGNSRYLYLLSAELQAGARKEEWNAWYDGTHVPELLTVPGFLSAERFRDLSNPKRYLAMYEIETPDVFEEPRYSEVTGWGSLGSEVADWSRAVYEVRRTEF